MAFYALLALFDRSLAPAIYCPLFYGTGEAGKTTKRSDDASLVLWKKLVSLLK